MPLFRYQALNDRRQLVPGELRADSVSEAVARLESEGLIVQSIVAAGPGTAATDATRDPAARAEIRPNVEQSVLESHLATVLARAQVIVPALRAYAAELPAGRRRRQFLAMLRVLEQGDLSMAARALAAGPEYWIPLLGAATAASDPGRVLHEFFEQSQRAVELRKQWWLTFAYPLVVAGLATGVLVTFSLMVVPIFRDIFREFELKLPPLTQWVLAVAWSISSGQVLVVAAVLVVIGVLLAVGTRLLPPRLQVWFGDRFGTPLGRGNAIARFAQFAADLLEAGLNVPNSLRVAGYTTRSARLQRGAWRLATEIESGHCPVPCKRPLTDTILFAMQGEMSTDSRIRLLRELSHCHHERAQASMSWSRGMIEPIAIGVIGLLVGLTVIALFLPLVFLIQQLSI